MADDIEYLANYKPNHLYTYPAQKGAFATIVAESEEDLGEVEITPRCRLAVKAFYVSDRNDFGSLKITKLRFHKTHGWQSDGHIQVNYCQAAQMAQLLSIISHLDLSEATKARVSLENVDVAALVTLLATDKGAAIVKGLAETPSLHQDIYAVAAKRQALAEFEAMLGTDHSEREWQAYFERNPWVFGHGLNYVFLDKVGPKLEARTTGNAFDTPGKTADALMRTRAEISQYVLIEIKKGSTDLLRKDPYRAGCWAVSDELSAAVTQTQKTAFQFSRDRFRDVLKDGDGNDTGELAYSVEPRSYLVIGNLAELRGNDHKIACFELYRRNTRSPEIVTFDELYQRAHCIVENISAKVEADARTEPGEWAASQTYDALAYDSDDKIPF
ncbi:MAG: Shedu immune nuclease family protein [Qipengyuania citrea]|uniref:Shedu immune nuclease family protein n=3 Tax=Pseudomonadota TaxID=1224 RepID=UPI0031345F74